MKCHEAKRHLDLFMDGELSVPENMKVLEHLNLCRPCSGIYEGEKALRGALKVQLGSEKVPASVYEKLSQTASPAEDIERPWRPSSAGPTEGRRWSAVAAAVFFVTLAGAMLFTPSIETAPAFAAVAAST